MYTVLYTNLDDMAIIHLVMPKYFGRAKEDRATALLWYDPLFFSSARNRADDARNGSDMLTGLWGETEGNVGIFAL